MLENEPGAETGATPEYSDRPAAGTGGTPPQADGPPQEPSQEAEPATTPRRTARKRVSRAKKAAAAPAEATADAESSSGPAEGAADGSADGAAEEQKPAPRKRAAAKRTRAKKAAAPKNDQPATSASAEMAPAEAAATEAAAAEAAAANPPAAAGGEQSGNVPSEQQARTEQAAQASAESTAGSAEPAESTESTRQPQGPGPEAPAAVAFQPPTVLFQPPTIETPPTVPAGKAPEGEPAESGEQKPSRRRRTRGGTAAVEADQTAETDQAAADQQSQPDQAAEADRAGADGSGRSTRGRRGRRAEPVGDEADSDDSDDGEESEGGRRRRRRRGGRRRNKNGTDDDSASDATSGATFDDAETGTDGSAESPAAESEDSEDDSDEDGGGSRRRRRRRRRRGESTDASPDDPEHTVVKVREPRKGDDEPSALEGSTRLEAKKQRRREGREAGRRRPPILTESEFLARREAVKRTMVIRQQRDRTQIAVLEDDVLVEHYVTRESQSSMIGNVYLGRVQNVLPSMEAAFIDIGRGRNAVLYAGEVDWNGLGHENQPRRIELALKSGQSVLVQVTKDPIGHKGARLTSQVSLPGRYLVYVPHGSMNGISRKLPDTERSRLKALLKDIVPDEAGVVVRTAAEGASEEELSRDVARLKAQWESIEKKAANGQAPNLLSAEPDLLIKVVRDLFTEDFARLVVSGDEAWEMVEGYVEHVAPHLADRLERWGKPDDVFTSFRIEEQIVKALDRKVWLPSGGSLVIDRTEAMTVIDVNTGKFTGAGGNLEETVTRNNLEAAEEIVRQLRLRDIGGIIVVDFIDMVLESNRDLVLRRLVECLGRDRTKHQVAEVTSLGLVQMTRKRIGTGLLESFSEPCEACSGRGVKVRLEPVEAPSSPNGEEEHSRRSRRRRRGGGGNGVAEPVDAEPVDAEPVDATPVESEQVASEAADGASDSASVSKDVNAAKTEGEQRQAEQAEARPAGAEPVDAKPAATWVDVGSTRSEATETASSEAAAGTSEASGTTRPTGTPEESGTPEHAGAPMQTGGDDQAVRSSQEAQPAQEADQPAPEEAARNGAEPARSEEPSGAPEEESPEDFGGRPARRRSRRRVSAE
ncbi:ribonuclease E/G [Actinopolymorpha singaporensis]|uniref:Ribonuclease E n=1 Tax=Actinopolymorpha singaporensis TaxID=117157 RepID=A0A1H1YE18_9ACTN|nr:Rne/Rng family ribonuclease [Actinopolymorpha singaporensis]SDT19687.1 ribonuclease E [Actinopolymorpha singaporensis]